MKFIEQFPTIAMFMAFFVMSCLFAYCGTILKIIIIFLALLFLLAFIFKKITVGNELRTALIFILSAGLAAGIWSFIFFDIKANSYEKHNAETDTVTLRITECDFTLSYAARYKAVIESSELIPNGSQLILNTDKTALSDGTILSGEVTYTALSEFGNDSFNGVHYYLPDKIMITADDVSLKESGYKSSFSLTKLFNEFNDKLSAIILAHVGRNAGGIATAVLLGNRDSLTDSVMRDFRRLGISHLLVVSGTHFSVIISFTERAMRRMHINRRLRALLNMIIIIFFMFLTGFTPSVVRAGIMHLLSQLAIIVSRKANMINSFAISGTVMILANPYSAMDCGLQLSFIATFSCIFFLQNRRSLTKALRSKGFRMRSRIVRMFINVFETILMTSLITINTLPLMWLYFGEISLISIPVNVIFIPLITILMYLSGLYILLYPLKIFIFPMTALLNAYCGILERLAGYFSLKDWIMLPVNYSFTIFFLVPLTVLLVIMPFSNKIWRKRVIVSICGICVTFFSVIGIVNLVDSQNIYFSYLPEKKNDGFVLKSDGKVLICEISDASFGYSYNLTNEISDMHCCEIETILITHYHNRHIQLLSRLCEREIVRNIVLPEPIEYKDRDEPEIYKALCETAERYGVDVTTIPVNGSFTFGDTQITLYERKYISRSTHPITSVGIDMNGINAVIASCSFNQSVPEITKAIEDADFPILGRHSPVYKKAIDLSLNKPMAIIVSSQAYEWLSDETVKEINDSNVILEPDEFRIKINRKNKVSMQAELSETP